MRHPGKPYGILPGLLLFISCPLFAGPPISLLLAGDTASDSSAMRRPTSLDYKP